MLRNLSDADYLTNRKHYLWKGIRRGYMANNHWTELAYTAVRQVAEKQSEFTPDDIWATGLQKPSEARALGGVMQRARREGLIEKTGRVQPTTQPESHGTDVTVWRSLIYVAPGA